MDQRVWSFYAPIYEKAMRADRKLYEFMYRRIPQVIEGQEVLEIATGPGLLAKHVADAAKRMVATDYAEGMIREAKKGTCPDNLTFEVADATALPYADNSFDAVLIANALHVMPDPEAALREIRSSSQRLERELSSIETEKKHSAEMVEDPAGAASGRHPDRTKLCGAQKGCCQPGVVGHSAAGRHLLCTPVVGRRVS